jgi:hypothetical protein
LSEDDLYASLTDPNIDQEAIENLGDEETGILHSQTESEEESDEEVKTGSAQLPKQGGRLKWGELGVPDNFEELSNPKIAHPKGSIPWHRF